MCSCVQGVRGEAIKLKDNTLGTLIKEEIEVTNCSKERNAVLEEYRFEFRIIRCTNWTRLRNKLFSAKLLKIRRRRLSRRLRSTSGF